MGKTITIKLPDDPKGKSYEDFIASYLQAGGYFVERNIIDRGVTEVLELDIIITDFEAKYPDPVLIEIKSGKWGFGDIFKIRGWLDYTVFDSGVLIVKQNKDHLKFICEKAKEIGVKVILNDDLNKTIDSLADFIDGGRIDSNDVKTFQYSYWLERNLLTYLNQKKKTNKGIKCFQALEKYYFKISSEIFLSKNLLDRIKILYRAFQRYPRITAKCSNELRGNNFDDDVSNISNKHFKETYYEKKLNIFQVSTFLEHYGRLIILKNCIEYLLCKDLADNEKVSDKEDFFGMKLSKLTFLPDTFLRGLDKLSTHKYLNRYPIFWQYFIYAFGGFILTNQKEKEYEILSRKSGIPVTNIDQAFSAFDLLFPTENGWFIELPKTKIRTLKMFSIPFAGIGINFRKKYYTKTGEFSELEGLFDDFTFQDLVKCNNLCVDILNRK